MTFGTALAKDIGGGWSTKIEGQERTGQCLRASRRRDANAWTAYQVERRPRTAVVILTVSAELRLIVYHPHITFHNLDMPALATLNQRTFATHSIASGCIMQKQLS